MSQTTLVLIDGDSILAALIAVGIDSTIIEAQLDFGEIRQLVTETLVRHKLEPGMIQVECTFTHDSNLSDAAVLRLNDTPGCFVEKSTNAQTAVKERLQNRPSKATAIVGIGLSPTLAPTVRSLRDQAPVLLFTLDENAPPSLAAAAFSHESLQDSWHLFFKYSYPRFDVEELTILQVRCLLSQSDDRKLNQLRVSQHGLVWMSATDVGSQKTGGLQFRYETFGNYNGYVGPKAASDKKWVALLHKNIQQNWQDGERGYIDYYV